MKINMKQSTKAAAASSGLAARLLAIPCEIFLAKLKKKQRKTTHTG